MTDQETTLAQLRGAVAEFVRARDWEQFHDPKNLAMSIAIEAAELMELFQWYRSDQLPETLGESHLRQRIQEELADVTCFVLSFANALDIDLSSAVRQKLHQNARKYPVEQYRGRFQ
ncbi:MAG TPA: nucleotide pyrophosphohydrolase [Phycisphaerae bacterium]|nr:nucleotide pyrophosphohydrolase [Phycisphaerae bacterium]